MVSSSSSHACLFAKFGVAIGAKVFVVQARVNAEWEEAEAQKATKNDQGKAGSTYPPSTKMMMAITQANVPATFSNRVITLAWQRAQ